MKKSLFLRIFLIVGVITSVLFPSPVSADTLTLRPSGTGDYTNISSQNPSSGAHWDKVDEATPDDNTTYVYTNSNSQQKDAYQLQDTAQIGTINSVTVYFRIRRSNSGNTAYCQPFLRLGTNETAGTEISYTSTTWATYSEVLARPGGGGWSWTDINNLQVCIGLRDSGASNRYVRCTQVYVVVDYTPCTPPDCTITAPSSVYTNSTGNPASAPDAGGGATYAWTITNGTITAGQGTRSITWSAGTVSPVTIGVTVILAGCPCTSSVQVIVTTPPTLAVDISGNLEFCEGSSTMLTANAAGGTPPYTYDWSDSTAPGTYSENQYTATGAGIVAVTVTDNNLCTTTIVSDNTTLVTQGNVPGATYPHNAELCWVHPSWWGGLTSYNFGYPSNTAQWIWESYYVVHPIDGDRVFFERTFSIPVTPASATLHITCDNGYEVYLNGFFVGSAQVRPCWLTDNLTDTCVDSGDWQSVETYSVTLQKGTNTLEIWAANEFMESGSGTPESNPGGVVYDLVYQYYCAVSDSVEVSVNPSPIASASSNSPVEEGSTIFLTGGPDGMTSYSWTGPDGFSSFEQSPSIPNATISMSGDYTLTVTNSYSCQDNATVNVTVNPASVPSVTALEIFEDQFCTQVADSMTPQSTYYARASIFMANNLENLQTVELTLFYNPTGADNMTAPTVADTQTCAILTCTVGDTPVWTIASGSPTSWTIETTECIQPPLVFTSGDWIFAFKPGKVATENTGVADWDAFCKATRTPSQTGELYLRDKDMNWYGEITVNTPSVDWGEVPLGLTSDNTTYNPETVSIHYIANGNYYEDIRSEDWASGGETVTLDETGIDPPAFPGMFALKADDTAVLGNAIIVSASYNHMNDSNGLTAEDGVSIETNSLWLSLSASGIMPGTYTGNIHFQIVSRN